MSDAAAFDSAQLDALAMCFVEAAVSRLLADVLNVETNPLIDMEKPQTRTNPGPALLTPETLQPRGHAAAEVSALADADTQRTIPEMR